MRYPDGGGLTAEQRKRREEVRMRAADLFQEGVKVSCIARELRVSEKSIYQWRRVWQSGSRAAGPRCAPWARPATTAVSARPCRPGLPAGWTRGRPRTAGRMTRYGQPPGCAR
ncbi:helix-turn-helix domain-containing protein [Streptomyces sp. NBC_00078]|uniref:helix-turn-helix domain-containing protein n=1 Tax=unclassified Streptomyces TaxID=2593676 RepID=UPI002B1DC363|nr:helix-turn-helix domain-containing protein [Streptomyces sp. NBC_00078]